MVRIKGRVRDKDGKAQKIYGDKTAVKHSKTGLISGYVRLPDKQQYKYFAPMIFKDTCNTITFNIWITRVFHQR